MHRFGRVGWCVILVAALLGNCIPAQGAAGAAAARRVRPNVLLLVADDWRADAVGALGHAVVKTPAVDGLAKSGLVFTNAYCFGSNVPAVCTPSRNMLLSGRTYFRWEGRHAPADGSDLPSVFRRAGYQTYYHGKRGNTAVAIERGFERHAVLGNDEAERRAGRPGQTIAEAAVRFLAERKDDDDERPFLMMLAFEAPHDPRVPASQDAALYDANTLPLPPNFLPAHPFDNGELAVRDEKLAPLPRTAAAVRKHLHDYYAVITGLDRSIGLVLEALRERGLEDDTIVIFTSDHGLAVGSHGLMGKQSVYEHSMKVPLIISGPGLRPGRSAALLYLHDLLPTLCDLTAVKTPDALDGRSLAPVIDGSANKVRDTLMLAYRDVQRSIRDERWKLIRYPAIDRTQLFDLSADPHERRDLSTDPARQPDVRRLTEALTAAQRQTNDPTELQRSSR